MTVSLATKLQLKRGATVRIINAPRGLILDLPIQPRSANILLFAASRADLERYAPSILARATGANLLWIAYPKKSSGIETDISRDHGWEPVTDAGWECVRIVAVDETWSALRFRPASPKT
jgi:hypothetical protein